MHKAKKKGNKLQKLPKPIKVKKEKTEEDRSLHPMSHYVDDRLELVKQIFGTLKPKTITNLAPDFLKKKNMVEIEEVCLNELLCISTKRLLSFINASKCPTDTESSEDSDVEHQEEHISLEEISSDSEIDESASGTRKLNGNDKQKNKKGTQKSSESINTNDGQISVLELLELQARARAIRSQLALEPVTKIEVDSADEEGKSSSEKKASNKNGKVNNNNYSGESKSHKRKSGDAERLDKSSKTKRLSEKTPAIVTIQSGTRSSKESTTATTTTINIEKPGEANSAAQSIKKVKLKRNYRNSNQERTSLESNTNEPATDFNKGNLANALKKDHKSRSPSPDVIPIVNEPETLLISDSEPEETVSVPKNAAAAPPPPVVNVIEKEPEEAEEGEITESDLEKSDQQDNENVCATSNMNVDGGQCDNMTPQIEGGATNAAEQTRQQSVEAERQSDEAQTIVESSEDTVITESNKSPGAVPTDVLSTTRQTKETPTTTTTTTKSASDNTGQQEDSNLIEYQDDADNDDVISIGGDLESEMIEHLEEEEGEEEGVEADDDMNSKSSSSTLHKTADVVKRQEEDVISLGSSADEEDKKDTESWHARYIKSSKVSKVLATSRLGKRVRDNIKMTKRKSIQDESASANEKQIPIKNFTSQHEDGSIEQYKELLRLSKTN